MALVAEGLTNDEIGERLCVSPVTVKTHVNRAMSKLGARDRAPLVVAAYQAGLVRPTGAPDRMAKPPRRRPGWPTASPRR